MFKWIKDMFTPSPLIEPITQRGRLDDIEDDIKELKNNLQAFVEDTEEALRKLKERVGSLEEKGEWTPKFGDRVRFKHPYFGEQRGICIQQYQDGSWQILWLDPSKNNDTSFCFAKDVEKDNGIRAN